MKTIKHFFKTFSLIELIQGMALTLRVMFRRKATVRYPEEKTPLSPRFRGMHALMRDENGEEKCIGCGQCKSKCPYGLDTPRLLEENYRDYQTFLHP